MRSYILAVVAVVFFGLAPKANGSLPFGVEGGTGLSFGGGSAVISFSGSALLNVYANFYARTSLIDMSITSGSSVFTLGTGSTIDVMYFFKPIDRYTPYGFGGVNILSGGGISSTNFRFGGGAEMSSQKFIVKIFGEASLDILSTSVEGASGSNTSFTIRAGVRSR